MKVDATNLIIYTPQDMVQGLKAIVDQMKNDDFDPDLVVGVVRGGAVPAVYISHMINRPVHMTHWSLRDGQCENDSAHFIYKMLRRGKKILLIDDIVDGGDTIGTLLMNWVDSVDNAQPLAQVRVASLWYNPSQPVIVNYYHNEIDRNEDSRWVVFDWEA